MTRRVAAMVCAVALLLLTLAPASAGLHVLLSVPGVEGNVEYSGFENWIACGGFQHNVPGMPKPLQLMSGNLPEAEGITYEPPTETALWRSGKSFVVSKVIDKASPQLFLFCQEGRRFPSIKLALMSVVGDKAEIVFGYELKDVLVTSYEVRAPGFGDRSGFRPSDPDAPMELLGLSPRSITYGRGTPGHPEG